MDSLLKRLKLIDHLTTEIPIERRDFVEKLKKNVDQGDTEVVFSPFEALSSSKNEYKGRITANSFRIRRRKKELPRRRNETHTGSVVFVTIQI